MQRSIGREIVNTCIRPMPAHNTVQTSAARREIISRLGTMPPINEAHEFGHTVTMEPRWPNQSAKCHQLWSKYLPICVLGNNPHVWRNDDKIGNSRSGDC
jgi:hypothetical protein